MDGAGHARLIRLLLGVVALLALGAVAVLMSSSNTATVAETPSKASTAPGKSRATRRRAKDLPPCWWRRFTCSRRLRRWLRRRIS